MEVGRRTNCIGRGDSGWFRRVGLGFRSAAKVRRRYAMRRWFHGARLIRAMQKATLRRSASPSYDAVGPSAFDPSGKGFQLVSHASCDLATDQGMTFRPRFQVVTTDEDRRPARLSYMSSADSQQAEARMPLQNGFEGCLRFDEDGELVVFVLEVLRRSGGPPVLIPRNPVSPGRNASEEKDFTR